MKLIGNSSRLVVWILLVALLIALPIMGFSFSSRLKLVESTTGIKIPGQTQTEVLVPYTGASELFQQDGSPQIPANEADAIETEAAQPVGLYDVFEVAVTNDRNYANPFDYQAIELQADFTAPSGKKVSYFGFYDGDGKGSSQGNVWKLRFMPDETGKWSYIYRWTDGADGGSGSFEVMDTGLLGPLKVAKDRSWYFMTARDEPFHWRGYDLHILARYSPTHSIVADVGWVKNQVESHVIDKGYNFIMLDGPINRLGVQDNNVWSDSWWLNGNPKVFNIPVWRAWEEILQQTNNSGVYVTLFAGMVYQGQEYGFEDFRVFLRYWVARTGAFYNYLGWSPTWEWTDIWEAKDVDQIMSYAYQQDPWKRLLAVHDCAHSSFDGWLGFSMRQKPSNSIFAGNSRTNGYSQGSCGQPGGIAMAFADLPIIGSEDIWEYDYKGSPVNAEEVRRGAWGEMMAGVLPLYSEWTPKLLNFIGEGEGEPEVIRMFDFFYSYTDYRRYQQMNGLVDKVKRQISSGIEGQEYLVYDENGGSITIDLSTASSRTTFSVTWFDPASGLMVQGDPVQGGDDRNLESPFEKDTVLLLKGR